MGRCCCLGGQCEIFVDCQNRGLIRELKGELDGACEDWSQALELGANEAEAYVKECNE